jgi:cysteine desulfurase/selenocysteine lyase
MPLRFMDHGASTHASQPVLDAVMDLHTKRYANIHRGNHTLSLESSDLFDGATKTFAKFIGANAETGCFVMGGNTTDSLSLAAHAVKNQPGATLTTMMEHHSNDLPHRGQGDVLHAEVDADGRVLLDDMEEKLQTNRIRLVAVSGCSNVTGYFPPIHKMARLAHDNGAKILIDAAQLYAHAPIDVKPDDHPEHIDMLAAAGHKAYAPFGSSFLYASQDMLDSIPPYRPGGGTVTWVTSDGAGFTKSPDRHMGGTPNITGVVAFAAATKWLSSIGMDNVQDHELKLTTHGLKRFKELHDDHGIALLGPKKANEKAGVFSFLVPGVHHSMVSHALSREHGIATRNGCFCAQPLLHRLLGIDDLTEWIAKMDVGDTSDIPGATRATIGIYQTPEDVDALANAVAAIAQGKFDDTSHPSTHHGVEVS